MLTQKEIQYLCGAVVAVMQAGGSQEWAQSKQVTTISKLANTVAPGVAAGLKKKGLIISEVDKVPHIQVVQFGWTTLHQELKMPENYNNTDSILEYAKTYLANCSDPLPIVKKPADPAGKTKTRGKAWANPDRKAGIYEMLKKSGADWVVEIMQQVGEQSRDEAELYYCFQALAETAIKGMKITQLAVVQEEEPETPSTEIVDEQSLDIALQCIDGVGMNRYDLRQEESV